MKVNPDTLIKLSYKRVFFLSLVFDLLIFYYNTLYLSCIFRFTKRYDSIRCFLYNPQTKVRQKSFIFRIIIINHHIPCCSTSQINFETICTYHRNNICRIIQMYNPQIQISAESETKRSIFREKDKTKRSKKESAQHSKSRNKSFVMTSVSAL